MMEIKKFYDKNGYYLPIEIVENAKIYKASEKLIKLYQNPQKISSTRGIFKLIY